MRIFGWVVGLAVALAAPVNALSIPSDGKLSFDVVRKGKDIGDHSYSFSGAGNSFTVKVETDIAVKVPLIRTTAYSFQHASVEIWKGGKLQQISSTTMTTVNRTSCKPQTRTSCQPAFGMTTSCAVGKLMNTIDGKIMKVRVADLGTETGKTKRGAVAVHHYRMSGDLARDLWYDGTVTLPQVDVQGG